MDTSTVLTRQHKTSRKRKRRSKLLKAAMIVCSLILLFFGGFMIWFYLTPSGSQLRYVLADTIITSRHRYLAKYLIGQKNLETRVAAINNQFNSWGVIKNNTKASIPSNTSKDGTASAASNKNKNQLVRIENVKGKTIDGGTFKGFIMYIKDPKDLRVNIPDHVGHGDKVVNMAKKTGALAAFNGGGFVDPNWKGNGFQPQGVVFSGGQLFYNDSDMNTPVNVVGFDDKGHMIAGKYTVKKMEDMHLQEAVSFMPRFIVNGKGLVKNEADGWGIAPRTCIAQKKDGTVMVAVIDGRQPGYSVGATLYDVQKLFLARGAIIAANLDGGTSTILVHNDKIVNSPYHTKDGLYLPTAWMVYKNPDKVHIKNIWKGMDPSKIDASTWK